MVKLEFTMREEVTPFNSITEIVLFDLLSAFFFSCFFYFFVLFYFDFVFLYLSSLRFFSLTFYASLSLLFGISTEG